MMSKIFISGTDTDVGKTLVSSWLCQHWGAHYWKPIQSGLCGPTDSQTVATLSGAYCHPEAYRLTEPLSPHRAAEIDGVTIDLQHCVVPRAERLVIEGAGGLLVPLNASTLVIDLIAHCNAPVILVARSSLGTINHTLLSLEALKKRGLPVLGVVMMGHSPIGAPTTPHANNRAALEHYGGVPVLAEFPYLTECTRASLSALPLPKALHERLA